MQAVVGALVFTLVASPSVDRVRATMKETRQQLGGVTVWPVAFSKKGHVGVVYQSSDEFCELSGQRIILSVFDLRSDRELERIDARAVVTGKPLGKAERDQVLVEDGVFHAECDRLTRDPRVDFAKHLEAIVRKYGLSVVAPASLTVKHDSSSFAFSHGGRAYEVDTLDTVCNTADIANLKKQCRLVDDIEGEVELEDVVVDVVLWRGKSGKVVARWDDAAGGCHLGQTSRQLAGVWLSPFESRAVLVQLVGGCFEGDVVAERVQLIGAHLNNGFSKPTYSR